ncbi:LuxR C-terminal-related transcriptional regulator [Plantactinospora sp. KBS50]|uniref:LuxR C-terminal-related transcriptional regulator n=1 Tax=Plantactinospora sp. KBS50 TaxID=2024580 RepID=UPI0018DFBE05|nr:LuxR C-terminal-related transcriptional regulator [Plantactinospora sp. KBS50]
MPSTDIDADSADRPLSVALSVGLIASSAGGARRRGAAVLRALRRLLPFDAGAVILFDPDRSVALPLAVTGYRALPAARTGPPARPEATYQELAGVRLDRPGPPRRLCDLTGAPGRALRDRLAAVGLPEGVGVPLTTSDGRCVGLLALHRRVVGLDDAPLEVLGRLSPTIANAVDPLRPATGLVMAIPRVCAGAVLTTGGRILPLPGLPGHPFLVPAAPLLDTAMVTLRDGRLYRAFLVPGVSGADHLCATVVPCPAEPPYLGSVAILLSPAGNTRGLTPRELEVMGLLVDGCSNRRIAATLFVTERTVAAHIEHILVKMEVPTRTMAALRALRLGLFVPRSLLQPAAATRA